MKLSSNALKKFKFTAQDAGCYIGNQIGWHANYMIIDLACDYGFKLSEDDADAVTNYRQGDLDTEIDGISDYALEYLNSLCDNTVYWEWHDGELFLSKVEDDDENR